MKNYAFFVGCFNSQKMEKTLEEEREGNESWKHADMIETTPELTSSNLSDDQILQRHLEYDELLQKMETKNSFVYERLREEKI